MKDMALCRWENVMLPGFNQVLNVWQPEYIHMFESVIARPQHSWCYVHLSTPGGNLQSPNVALDDPQSRTPRVGVLMRIISATRKEDSSLSLVVQALARVRVLEQVLSPTALDALASCCQPAIPRLGNSHCMCYISCLAF